MVQDKEQWSKSDKLAVALFCLGAVMALVLFLVEKTPLTVGFMIFFIIGLLVFPIIHFFSAIPARVVSLILMLGIVGLFGWNVWPHREDRKPDTSPPQKAVGAQSPLVPPVPAPRSTQPKITSARGSISSPAQPPVGGPTPSPTTTGSFPPLSDAQLKVLADRPGGLVYNIYAEMPEGHGTAITSRDPCITFANVVTKGGDRGFVQEDGPGVCLHPIDPSAPWRISEENRKILSPYLSAYPSTIEIQAWTEDEEGQRFAKDWYSLFLASGWKTTQKKVSTVPFNNVGVQAQLAGKNCIPNGNDKAPPGRAMYAISAVIGGNVHVACSEEQDGNLVIVFFGRRK